MPDAAEYHDEGSNTLLAASRSPYFSMPNMRSLGYFNIDGVHIGGKEANPKGAFARLTEVSKGKDTTIGHWEIAGVISSHPLPTFPNGFPQEIIEEFEQKTGRGVLCNRPYSGTDVIRDYGKEHMETGKLIVYTSADSVFQVAAHEEVVPIEELYRDCQIARNMLTGKTEWEESSQDRLSENRGILPVLQEDMTFLRTAGSYHVRSADGKWENSAVCWKIIDILQNVELQILYEQTEMMMELTKHQPIWTKILLDYVLQIW